MLDSSDCTVVAAGERAHVVAGGERAPVAGGDDRTPVAGGERWVKSELALGNCLEFMPSSSLPGLGGI